MNLEVVLKLFSSVVPGFPLFSHFTSLSTLVEERGIKTNNFENITFNFQDEHVKFLNANKLQVLK